MLLFTGPKAPREAPMGSFLDRGIAYFSPSWALRRAHARQVLAYYEAAKPTTTRKARRENASGDVAVYRAGRSLREQARHLEQNHDIARGALAVLVANIVGAQGITVEPQPRNRDGSINTELANQIRTLLKDWGKVPEVTGTLRWPAAQRLAVRAWVRDGEFLAQKIAGPIASLNHGTLVPFSIELIEADYLPFELNSSGNPWITQGVERNGWGRPRAYHLHKSHPGDWFRMGGTTLYAGSADLRRVSADNMLHVKIVDRFRQARGVSVFASVLERLDDIHEYERSERVAAKVAASMAAFIRKGNAEQYAGPHIDANGNVIPRDIKFRPGMVFDDLLPGEEIGTIDTNRPNTNLENFRNSQLRAAASGFGTSFSSLSKAYLGSYSSQRQELVEAYMGYAVLQEEFASQFVAPIYESFLAAAATAGLLTLPRTLDPLRLDDALYIGPQMPWIDPAKEAKSWAELERNGHASGPEIIRRRGQNPDDVFEQERNWRERWVESGLQIATDPANDGGDPQLAESYAEPETDPAQATE